MQFKRLFLTASIVIMSSSMTGCSSFIKWVNDDDNSRLLSDEVKGANYFNYEVFGNKGYVQVFDDGNHTTLILPKGYQVTKAWLLTKHGRISQPVVQQGPYFIVQGLGNQWKVETTMGDLVLQRADELPQSVTIQSQGWYVERLKQEIYDLIAQLTQLKRQHTSEQHHVQQEQPNHEEKPL